MTSQNTAKFEASLADQKFNLELYKQEFFDLYLFGFSLFRKKKSLKLDIASPKTPNYSPYR